MKTLALAILFSLHPVHVSMTGIDYDAGKRSYNVFIKLYCDDLLLDMKLDPVKSDNNHEIENDKYCDYLNNRVSIIENGKNLEMKIVATETDGVERRFTLIAKGRRRTEEVTIINRIMTRLHPDQANMMLFKFSDIEDAYKFTASDTLRNYIVK